LLPPKLEDEYIKEAMKIITNPTEVHYKKMINICFSNISNSEIDIDKVFSRSSKITEIQEVFKNFVVNKLHVILRKY